MNLSKLNARNVLLEYLETNTVLAENTKRYETHYFLISIVWTETTLIWSFWRFFTEKTRANCTRQFKSFCVALVYYVLSRLTVNYNCITYSPSVHIVFFFFKNVAKHHILIYCFKLIVDFQTSFRFLS